ncbi:MAG: hypothetical protein ACFFFT_02905 [Candidatus Thorarchaeota archaeon]
MKLQFYETMQDKSKEYLTYLIDQILPKFTIGEFKCFLEDIKNKTIDKSKGTKASKTQQKVDFANIGDDVGKFADLSKLDEKHRKILFKTFISAENNDKIAVKWRFYQYLKYHIGLNIKVVQINKASNHFIDFIIETDEKEKIFVSCHDILDLDNFNEILNKIAEFVKKENLIPDRLIFSACKSFRNIPIEQPFKIGNTEISPELWIEWIEENIPFSKEDLLIVDNSELKLAGFNFTSTEDLLNFVYKNSDGGQISIFKQSDFFTETSDNEVEIELVWKGIMIK